MTILIVAVLAMIAEARHEKMKLPTSKTLAEDCPGKFCHYSFGDYCCPIVTWICCPPDSPYVCAHDAHPEHCYDATLRTKMNPLLKAFVHSRFHLEGSNKFSLRVLKIS